MILCKLHRLSTIVPITLTYSLLLGENGSRISDVRKVHSVIDD